MKKLIVIAALAAASFAAPAVPVQAASGDYSAYCYLTPLLSECRGIYTEATDSAASVTVSVASSTREAIEAVKLPVPYWWNCAPAPAGSGHLYDCE